MNKYSYFKFYPSDWLGSTERAIMTPEQEGAFISLLCHAWCSDDCGLPNDEDQLRILSRLLKRWNRNRVWFQRCFYLDGNRWYNKKLLEMRKSTAKIYESKVNAGIKSAERRAKAALENPTGVERALNGRAHNQNQNQMLEPESEKNINPPVGGFNSLKEKNKNMSVSDEIIKTIYKAYPRHLAPKKAYASISKAIQEISEQDKISIEEAGKWLLEKTKKFAASPMAAGLNSPEGNFIKHPSTWFNQGCYLEDEKDWQAKTQPKGQSGTSSNLEMVGWE